MNREEKIKALRLLQSGKMTFYQIFGPIVEFWRSTDKDPKLYENEITGQVITADQLEERKRLGNCICWIEHKMYKEDDQKPENRVD